MRTILTAVLMLTVFTIGISTTHKVPQDFATIQSAINAAMNGDTVLVSEGTYVENIVITKKIVLGSLFITDADISHISKTVLDGSSPHHADSASVITIDGATDTTTIIIGLTIKGGTGNLRATPTVYKVGLGIDIAGGGATIRKNNITANNVTTVLNIGGVVNIWDVNNIPGISFVIVEENTIADNVLIGNSVEGGAFSIGHSCRIAKNMIHHNSVTGTSVGIGAAAQIWNGTITIDGNLIVENNASSRGGAIEANQYLSAGPTITLINNIIANNTAGSQGGAMWFQGLLCKIYSINNTIFNNSSPVGAGVYIRDNSSLSALNTILWNPAGTEVSTSGGMVSAQYCLVRGGFSGIGNINSDPQFLSTHTDSLGLLKISSPCIGAGAVSATVGGSLLTAPLKDYRDLSRPNPSWSTPDIGAMESELAFPGALHTYRVPQDYIKIQEAINTSVNGDVVLVFEGNYTENLLINKKITLASLYYVDNDTSHISKTIIDGSTSTQPDTGATITCLPGTDTTTLITGLTITGGKGNKHVYTPPTYWIEGGGIDVMSGGATIHHNIIRNNALISFGDSLASAGISVVTLDPNLGISHVIIEDNLLTDNSLTSVYGEGGGIGIYDSKARIMRNKILNNIVTHTGGIFAYNKTVSDTVFIEQNLVQGNHASVNIGGIVFSGPSAVGMIRNNTVIDNTANAISGIAIGWSAYAIVDRNYIARNVATNGLTGGVYLFQTLQKSIICNNIIAENTGAGIHTNNSSSAIAINNTIVNNNAYGLKNSSGSLYSMNNIVKNSGTEINGTVYASYNMIEGGYSGTLNINADPLFVPGDTLYKLSTGSPCLGKGRLTATVGGVVLNAPGTDYSGVTRPLPASTWPDLGASESIFTGDVKEAGPEIPTEFALSQNYPNPFNPTTTIRFTLPQSAMVKLTIYDLLGREIETLVDEVQSAGWKEVRWQAHNVTSGLYFCRMEAGEYTATRKMVVLR
ncbi:MAG: right-handed parallel beta-helix repeat-containing protein [Bacteroidota bacterium]